MHAEKWGTIVGALLRKGADAPAAKWEACCGAVEQADQLVPWPPSSPGGWTHEKENAVDRLRLLTDIDSIRDAAASTCPGYFGVWRAHIQDTEAKNAARLQVLIWVAQSLYAMRNDADLSDGAGQMIDKVRRNLETHWKIMAADVPIDTPYRVWCTARTRDYRLLPKAWRFV